MDINYILFILSYLIVTLLSTFVSQKQGKIKHFFAYSIPLILIFISPLLFSQATNLTDCTHFDCINDVNPYLEFVTKISSAFMINYSIGLFLTKNKFKFIPTFVFSLILGIILINPISGLFIKKYVSIH